MADDPLKQLWLDIQQRAWNEGQALKQAPGAFALAVIIVCGPLSFGIWQLVEMRYAERIAVLQATIQQLQAVKPASVPSAQPRDPDAIFQLGRHVGNVESPRVDESKSVVWFDRITGAIDFDKNREFEYRNYVLQVRSLQAESRVDMAGQRSRALNGVVCVILSRK
jgi:hypothetical protein